MESSTAHQQGGRGLPRTNIPNDSRQLSLGLAPVLREDFTGNIHPLKNPAGNDPLFDMLRFVLPPGLPPPPYKQEHRNAIDLGGREGYQGIEGIALTGILHIDQGRRPRSEIMPGGQGDGAPLVGGRHPHVAGKRRQLRTEIFQQGIWNTRKELNAQGTELV